MDGHYINKVKDRIKKNILFLIPSLRPGGAERVIVTLLCHLDREKFNLTLLVVDNNNCVFLNYLPNDVEVISLNCRRVRYALPQIIATIWKRRPDVVFSTLGYLNLALAIARPILPNKPCYIARETTIVSMGLQFYPYSSICSALYRWFYKNHDQVVCQSLAMQKDLVEQFDFPKSKTIVINNPVDISYISKKSVTPVSFKTNIKNSIKLISAGRLVHVKGFDILLEAITLVNDQSIHLTILGAGPLEKDLKCLAKQKEITNQVFFAGFQSNPYAWFAQADAFVLSSRYEGFPNVVLEALACGTPVIATPAPGGTREILEDLSGCVIAESIDSTALADAIKKWTEGDRERIFNNCIESYSIDNILKQYEKTLSAVSPYYA